MQNQQPTPDLTCRDGAASPRAARNPIAYAAAAIVFLVLIAYAPSLSSGFVRLDDYQYVVDNELVRHPSWTSLSRFFTEVRKPSTVEGYYQPLTMASLMLDAWIMGEPGLDSSVPRSLDPFIYHLTNILLHAATCVLLLLVVREAVGGWAVPLIATLLFAVHPAHCESVAWISQRKTVLSTLLAVGSVFCYLKHAKSRRPAQLIASVLLYAVGGLAKPTVMLLPLVLPLLDIWPLRRRWLPALIGKLPFFACMIPMAWIAWTSQAASSAQLMAPHLSTLDIITKWLGLTSYNFMLYLGNLFCPLWLSPYRELPADLSLANPAILLSVGGTIGLAVVVISAVRWAKPLFVGGTAFTILLLPALGTVRFAETCVADRFLYLPAVFLVPALAALIARLELPAPTRTILVRVGAVSFAIPLLILMWPQQGVWHNSHALWSHVVESAPNLPKGHAQLASGELETGEFKSALQHAQRAVDLAPNDPGYRHVLGRCLVRTGEPGHAQRAVDELRRAIDQGLGPIEPLAHVSVAEALIVAGDPAAADAECRRAIEMGRTPAATLAMLGDVAFNLAHDYDVAADYYGRALRYAPENVLVRQFRAKALEISGNLVEAVKEYEITIETYEKSGRHVPIYLKNAVQEAQQRLGSSTTPRSER